MSSSSTEISIKLETGEKILIKGAEDHNALEEWVQSEHKFWNKITTGGHSLAPIKNALEMSFNELSKVIVTYKTIPDEMRKNFQSRMEHLYVNTKTLVYSQSREGKLFEQIFEKHGALAATAALSVAKGHSYQPNTFAQMKGVVALINAEAGVSDVTPAATKKALEALLTKHSSLLEKTEKEYGDTQIRLAKLVTNIKRRKTTLTTWAKKQRSRYLEEVNSKVDSAVKSINNTEAVYKEFMQLRAPAAYWTNKKSEHKTNADNYRKYLLWLATLSFLVLFCAVFKLFGSLSDATKFTGNMALSTALFILISTAVIWAIRILVRLYLSEHHLSIDAAQRETMTMTYLAMMEEGAADKEQREKIIEALFRPTSDGLVKDDALPSWMLSKHITG